MNQRVTDLANEMCMQARRGVSAAAFGASFSSGPRSDVRQAEPALVPAPQRVSVALSLPYQVHFGLYQANVTGFSAFAAALAFYTEHLSDAGGYPSSPTLLGACHDDEVDGLTDDEREAVQTAVPARMVG